MPATRIPSFTECLSLHYFLVSSHPIFLEPSMFPRVCISKHPSTSEMKSMERFKLLT
uniref:Hydroxyacyl-thioester dehydratase type 2-like n=1 Tax=Rhizophora mucronata TaxID=61149 RepID=A0A2P2K5J0_RHIMU